MTKTIRSLERGLRVLQALHASPISSLQDIYQSTRIPKPTLLRILLTLERAGAVSRRLADGRYRISANLTRLTRKRDRFDRVAEAAAPVLDRLCQKLSWPSDLMVPAGDHLEIRETSRTKTPLMILYDHDRIGTPVNWLMSAVGRAYLAYCPESERKKVIDLLRKSDRRENWLARDQKRLEEIFSETRTRGYGLRDPAFVGGPYGAQQPDGLAGIAVALRDRNRVHGVINIVWPRAARSVEDMVRDCLPDLQAAADEIVSELRGQVPAWH
jgi:IclR family mhp operon transcriptional activator